MIERTLVLVKPDGVQRALIGRVIERFENAGLKIVGMKMVWADRNFAEKHYTEDIAIRRGKEVREVLLQFITAGPVVAMVLEGVEVVEVVRKLVGGTEPKMALPGTIRGDFSHHSIAHTNELKKSIANLIHASGNKQEAEAEIKLWFDRKELHSYKTVHDIHVF